MLISYITASKVIDIAQYSLMIAEECRLCWLVYTRGKLEEREGSRPSRYSSLGLRVVGWYTPPSSTSCSDVLRQCSASLWWQVSYWHGSHNYLSLSPLQACPTSPRWCGRARSCPPGSATSSRHSWWVTGSSSCSTGPSCPSVWTTTRAMSTREFPCWAPYTTYHTRGFSSRNKIVWYKSDDYYKDSSAQTQQNLKQR